MLKILKNKFDNFVEEQSQKIYIQMLEKFTQSNMNQNRNIIDVMKSKEEIKNEANEAIKKDIKEMAEENFLKKSSSLLFKDIIQVFKLEMINKINKFVANVNNNEMIQIVFKSFGILDLDKELKIEEEFKKYIKKLIEIEKKSYEKFVNFQDDENEGMN